MMRCKLFAGLALAGFLFSPALAAGPAEAAGAGERVAALCYQGESGFMVSPPAGWVNLPGPAAAHGLCAIYAPPGYDFDNAPVIIYPRVLARPPAPDPVQTLADEMLARFAALPGGGRASLAMGPPLHAESGLRFETRYFNDGPDPNNYELVAYYVGAEAVLLLALSARSEPERRAGEAALQQAVRDVFPMLVRDKTGSAQ